MMNNVLTNPHGPGLEYEIWEMCVRRDLGGFVSRDWSIIAGDFDEEFFGIDACGSNDPLQWIPKFPTLNSYRLEFEKQADAFSKLDFAEDPLLQLGMCLTLSDIRIAGDRMLLVKTFNGELPLSDSTTFPLKWKSLFHLKYGSGSWRITGFVGYLPL